MKIIKVDHIGVAVNSIEASLKFFANTLGLKLEGQETVAEQKVTTAFMPVGDTEVELLQSTAPDGPIAGFIEKKCEGVQHVAFLVDNIEEALKELEAKGIRLIDKVPRMGAGGKKIAFVHPKDTYGVLVELCQKV
ncbi:MAG: methylmalonyl-CoA epimerase [Syntrophales bacterium]